MILGPLHFGLVLRCRKSAIVNENEKKNFDAEKDVVVINF